MKSLTIFSQRSRRSKRDSIRRLFLILFCGLTMLIVLGLYVVYRQTSFLILGLFLLCPLLYLLTIPNIHFQELNDWKAELR